MSAARRQLTLTCGIVGLAVCGAVSSGILLAQHDGGWNSAEASGSSYLLQLCHSAAMPSVSCADVVGSRWGSFDLPIGSGRVVVPLSFIGFAYFTFAAIWFTFTGARPAANRLRKSIVLIVAAMGCSTSVALLWLMAYSIRSWCPLCVAVHIANMGFLGMLIAGHRTNRRSADPILRPRQSEPARSGELRLAVLAAITALGAVVGGWLLYDRTIELRRQWRKARGLKQVIESVQADAALMLSAFFAETSHDIPVKEEAATDPRPIMVVFRDVDSDASACFEADWRERFAAAVGSTLRVEYRHAPRDTGGTSHWASARAIEAAGLQGNRDGYERLVSLLFRTRDAVATRDLSTLARRAGLDVARFEHDLHSAGVYEAVEADRAVAEALGVEHSPAVFIEGRRVPNLCLKSETFWAVVGRADGLNESMADGTGTWPVRIATRDAPKDSARP